jgi:hypothetical protein
VRKQLERSLHGRGSLLKTQHGTPSVSEGRMTLIFAISGQPSLSMTRFAATGNNRPLGLVFSPDACRA